MIRIVRSSTLRDLRERADLLDEMMAAQDQAREALASPDRAARRRAHRELWRDLPKPEERS